MLTKTLSEAKKKQRNILIKAMNNDIGSIDSAKDSWNPAQISERAKDISYIRSLVDSWNPAQLNEALKMLDLPVIDTWNPAQIEEQRRNLVFYLAERTLTGNPITLKILGNLTPEVTGLKVTMNPIQSGSGDPSPTNIRHISGRTEVSVTRTAGEDVETHTHQYSETIYGGIDDFVNGGATVTQYGVNAISLPKNSWAVGTKTVCYRVNLPYPSNTVTASQKHGAISSMLVEDVAYVGVSRPNEEDHNAFAITTDGLVLAMYDDDLTLTEEQFKTKYNDLVVVYPLGTPTTISTTAEEITLLKGNNVLSTDGDSIELKYKQNF